jgi:hypothetical protein
MSAAARCALRNAKCEMNNAKRMDNDRPRSAGCGPLSAIRCAGA